MFKDLKNVNIMSGNAFYIFNFFKFKFEGKNKEKLMWDTIALYNI